MSEEILLKIITSWNTESEYQLKKIKSFVKRRIKKFIYFLENEFNFQERLSFQRNLLNG